MGTGSAGVTGPSGGRGRVILAGGGLDRGRKLSNLMRGGVEACMGSCMGMGHSVWVCVA